MSYIEFVIKEKRLDRKTDIWDVFSKTGHYPLGGIKWYPAWRKYCFYPESQTVFDSYCLDEIASFLAIQNKIYKEDK